MKTLSTTTRTFVAVTFLTLAVGSGAPMAEAQGGPAPTLCETMLTNYQAVCTASMAASAALGPDSTDDEKRHAAVLNAACSNAADDYNNVCILYPA